MIIKDKDNNTTNFETYGEKNNPAILLIHGIGAEYSSWLNQIEEFKNNEYFVIAIDMYGHGSSSDLKGTNLDEWNIQILNLINHLQIKKLAICGVSMGGVIAQNFTIENTDKVSALIISDSFGELKTFNEKILGFSQIIGFKLFKILGNKIFAKGMAAAYKQEFASTARKYMYESSLNANFDQLLKSRIAINKTNSLEELSKIKIPALVTVGDSFGESFVKINKKISEAIPDSRFVVIKNSMDPSPLVNPTEFNGEVISFLNKLK